MAMFLLSSVCCNYVLKYAFSYTTALRCTYMDDIYRSTGVKLIYTLAELLNVVMENGAVVADAPLL